MSAHIERTIRPANADRTRTHLNRELLQFPEGVKNRTQAMAVRMLLTGTNEDMKRIEANGQLSDWCNDNLQWLRETYGEKMNKYGLQRGIDGSIAKHISTSEYYKDMINQQESIQENIEVLLKQKEEAQLKKR